MKVHYWFILDFRYSVYFLLKRQCLCLLLLLNIQISVQETVLNINLIISQSHYPKSKDNAGYNRAPRHCCHQGATSWDLVLVLHDGFFLSDICQSKHKIFVPISTAFIQENFWISGPFHLFKRKSATLNRAGTAALSCITTILPGGKRFKTCLTYTTLKPIQKYFNLDIWKCLMGVLLSD